MIGILFKIIKLFCTKIQDKITTLIYLTETTCGENVTFLSSSKISNIRGDSQSIKIGSNSIIKGELLTYKHGGQINIGKDFFLGENSRIWSDTKIEIGDRVLISHNVNIHDNNSHPINNLLRAQHFAKIRDDGHPSIDPGLNGKPIKIGNDVWIGFNCILLKGIKIGDRSIIAAGTIVLKDVLPDSIIGGNPVKSIKKNEELN
jgi:acetyltransferase-like isoleucine patch superfamily enzyme